LARCLAQRLAFPLLPRDAISEALADALGSCAAEQRRDVVVASFRIFYRLMAEALSTGAGVVAETNFHRGVAEDDVRPFLTTARVVIIYCHVAPELSFRRFVGRFERGERHWSSFDAERIRQIQAGRVPEAWARAQPLELAIPSLSVDTTDGYVPDLEGIVTFVRSAGTLDHGGSGDGCHR